MVKIMLKSEFITLGQLLKIVGVVSSGGEAKNFINSNKILVNNDIETRRGRKLREGDLVVFLNHKILIEGQNNDSKH